jgi:flagellar assembly protein FliH
MTRMMNTSFSQAGESAAITVLEYRDVGFDLVDAAAENEKNAEAPKDEAVQPVSLSREEFDALILQTAAAAREETERKLRQEFELRMAAERDRIGAAVAAFQCECTEYYSRVEPELVHLILGVAAKILHREAQVDRMLLAALAKVAVENLQQRSHVVLRVPPEACAEWREFFAVHPAGTKVEILEDSQLGREDCVLETELGCADVGIGSQLKEIERGFFDLLAKRPESR